MAIFKLGIHIGGENEEFLLAIIRDVACDLCYVHKQFDPNEIAIEIGLKNNSDLNEFIEIVGLIRVQTEGIKYRLSDWFKNGRRYNEAAIALIEQERY